MPRNNETNARIVAAVMTLLVAAAIFLGLWLFYLPVNPSATPEKVNPSFMALEEDLMDPEEFIEPPMVVEEQASDPNPIPNAQDRPAPSPLGEPEPAVVKSEKVVTNADNPVPNKSAEKLVTQTKPSPVQNTKPSQKDEPDSKISGDMKNKFAHNGTPSGKETGATGTVGSTSTGNGTSTKGVLNDGGNRTMLSCNNKFPISISKPITVIIDVTVNDKGRVTSAVCRTSLSDTALKQKLIDESKRSTWTPKAGAPEAKGKITWTLVPATK